MTARMTQENAQVSLVSNDKCHVLQGIARITAGISHSSSRWCITLYFNKQTVSVHQWPCPNVLPLEKFNSDEEVWSNVA